MLAAALDVLGDEGAHAVGAEQARDRVAFLGLSLPSSWTVE